MKNKETRTQAKAESVLSDLLSSILSEAITVLYLSDNSDYESALWKIIKLISPEAYKMMDEDEEQAFDTYVAYRK